jgi:arylformamidase
MLYRDFATQEELDREYDVESIHPDFDGVVARFLGLSEEARTHPGARFDVPFGPTVDEHVDIYPAAGEGPRPVLIFIHGGYWRILSSKEFALAAPGPGRARRRRGRHELLPGAEGHARRDHPPEPRHVKWVHEHAASWGGDPVGSTSGHSAGGQQTALLLATDWEGEYRLPADVIKGGIPISGVFDLRPLPYTWVAPALQLSRRTVETQSPALLPPPDAAPDAHRLGRRGDRRVPPPVAGLPRPVPRRRRRRRGAGAARRRPLRRRHRAQRPHSALTDATLALIERTS